MACCKRLRSRNLIAVLLISHCPGRIVSICACSSGLAKVLITLLNRKEDLTAHTAKLLPLHSEAVLIIHFPFCFLRVFHIEIVYEGMRPKFRIKFGLFHPDCPHTTMFLKNSLKCSLLWQLRSDRESHEQSCAVNRSKIVLRYIALDHTAAPIGV